MLARRSLLLATGLGLTSLIGLPSLAQAAGAVRDKAAEAWVLTAANETIRLLADKKTPAADRGRKFRDYMETIADVGAIANFVLGRYAKTQSAPNLLAYRASFKEYALAVYETQLNLFKGESVSVVDSSVKKNGIFVRIKVKSKTRTEDLEMMWRVAKVGTGYKVFDVFAFGTWLAIEQRADFETIMDSNNGDLTKLTAFMDSYVAKARSANKESVLRVAG